LSYPRNGYGAVSYLEKYKFTCGRRSRDWKI
jgi:hypothetical protein